MILFILIFFINGNLIHGFNINAENRYISSLPEQDRKEFLERVAKRITEDKSIEEVSGLESYDIPDSEIKAETGYVEKLLQEEREHLKRRQLLRNKSQSNSTTNATIVNNNEENKIEVQVKEKKIKNIKSADEQVDSNLKFNYTQKTQANSEVKNKTDNDSDGLRTTEVKSREIIDLTLRKRETNIEIEKLNKIENHHFPKETLGNSSTKVQDKKFTNSTKNSNKSKMNRTSKIESEPISVEVTILKDVKKNVYNETEVPVKVTSNKKKETIVSIPKTSDSMIPTTFQNATNIRRSLSEVVGEGVQHTPKTKNNKAEQQQYEVAERKSEKDRENIENKNETHTKLYRDLLDSTEIDSKMNHTTVQSNISLKTIPVSTKSKVRASTEHVEVSKKSKKANQIEDQTNSKNIHLNLTSKVTSDTLKNSDEISTKHPEIHKELQNAPEDDQPNVASKMLLVSIKGNEHESSSETNRVISQSKKASNGINNKDETSAEHSKQEDATDISRESNRTKKHPNITPELIQNSIKTKENVTGTDDTETDHTNIQLNHTSKVISDSIKIEDKTSSSSSNFERVNKLLYIDVTTEKLEAHYKVDPKPTISNHDHQNTETHHIGMNLHNTRLDLSTSYFPDGSTMEGTFKTKTIDPESSADIKSLTIINTTVHSIELNKNKINLDSPISIGTIKSTTEENINIKTKFTTGYPDSIAENKTPRTKTNPDFIVTDRKNTTEDILKTRTVFTTVFPKKNGGNVSPMANETSTTLQEIYHTQINDFDAQEDDTHIDKYSTNNSSETTTEGIIKMKTAFISSYPDTSAETVTHAIKNNILSETPNGNSTKVYEKKKKHYSMEEIQNAGIQKLKEKEAFKGISDLINVVQKTLRYPAQHNIKIRIKPLRKEYLVHEIMPAQQYFIKQKAPIENDKSNLHKSPKVSLYRVVEKQKPISNTEKSYQMEQSDFAPVYDYALEHAYYNPKNINGSYPGDETSKIVDEHSKEEDVDYENTFDYELWNGKKPTKQRAKIKSAISNPNEKASLNHVVKKEKPVYYSNVEESSQMEQPKHAFYSPKNKYGLNSDDEASKIVNGRSREDADDADYKKMDSELFRQNGRSVKDVMAANNRNVDHKISEDYYFGIPDRKGDENRGSLRNCDCLIYPKCCEVPIKTVKQDQEKVPPNSNELDHPYNAMLHLDPPRIQDRQAEDIMYSLSHYSYFSRNHIQKKKRKNPFATVEEDENNNHQETVPEHSTEPDNDSVHNPPSENDKTGGKKHHYLRNSRANAQKSRNLEKKLLRDESEQSKPESNESENSDSSSSGSDHQSHDTTFEDSAELDRYATLNESTINMIINEHEKTGKKMHKIAKKYRDKQLLYIPAKEPQPFVYGRTREEDTSMDTIDAYINVVKELINEDNKALHTYDWLATTVDIRAAIRKLNNLSGVVNENVNEVHKKDLQLLKYLIYLHNDAKNNVREKEERGEEEDDQEIVFKTNKMMKRNQLSLEANSPEQPMTLRFSDSENKSVPEKIKELIKNIKIRQALQKEANKYLSRRAYQGRLWLNRKGLKHRVNDLRIFVEDIGNVLDELHNAIKQISLITTFKNQHWFKNLRELYLDPVTDKKALEIVLHLELTRLLELIEKSSENGLSRNYVRYAMSHEKDVEKTKEEFNIVMELYLVLRKLH